MPAFSFCLPGSVAGARFRERRADGFAFPLCAPSVAVALRYIIKPGGDAVQAEIGGAEPGPYYSGLA